MKRNTTIDDTSPLISYYSPTSSWHRSNHGDPNWTEYYLSGYIMSDRLGDSATFFFIGTGVWIYGALRSNHGLYNVTLDGVTITRDGRAPGEEGFYQQVLFGASNLTLGPHTVTLTNNRDSGYFTNLDLDFIVFEEDLGGTRDTSNSTIVEDDETAFVYGPVSTAWNTHPDSISSYRGSSGHTTENAAAYVDYSFNGSAVTVFGALGPRQGSYSVTIDRGPATIYTAYLTESVFGQILYHVTGLTAGRHTVRLTNMPGNSGEALSIDYAIVDAIQVPNGPSSSSSIISTTSTSSTITSSFTSITSTTSTSSTTSSSTSSIISTTSTSLTTSSITSSIVSMTSASSTISSNTTAALPTETNAQLSSVGVSTLVIVAAVLCGLAVFTMLGFALMTFRRWRENRRGLDNRPDMAAIRPEPYPIGRDDNRGSGRYIPRSMNDGNNPADSGGPTLYSPDGNPRNTNAPGYFGQHIDGTSLFSGLAPAQPPLSGHSNSTHQQERQHWRLPSSTSTGLPYIQSDVASTSPSFTTYSDGASRFPPHGHSTMTEPSLIPLLRISPQ